ncbi:glycosyltransferase [Shimia sp.]|uniref:glycosyltransferase n=1 Tax=Shimia sp. TaxID=1954381 RepID=UPI003298EC0F
MFDQSHAQKLDAKPTVSVVICAYSTERLEILRKAIQSVQSQIYQPLEIVVVIDHNPILLATLVTEFSDVNFVENEGSKGLSDARNTGVGQAKGEVVAFLDDDAIAEQNWLSRLADAYADQTVAAVGGGITPEWPYARPFWFPEEFDWVIGCSYRGLPTTAGPVRNLIGCNMSMRRSFLESAGGFRTDFGRVGNDGAGCEETELFIRGHQACPDAKVWYDPEARVRHQIAQSRTRWNYFRSRCRAEGRAKANMTRFVGKSSGLSTEKSYVRKILPAGILRGIGDFFRGDFAGLARSGVIIHGFAVTAGAYVVAAYRSNKTEPSAASSFNPIRIVDTDITEEPPALSHADPVENKDFGAAWCLVRSDRQPVKILEIPFNGADITAHQFEEIIAADPTPLPPAPLPQVLGNEAPHVTIVIATRDRPDSLARCLDALLLQTYEKMDVVVVDNAPSSDATEKLISEHYAPSGNVLYVRESIPGLARAHNRGVSCALGEIIAFTDDDVICDPEWVSAIAANFAASDQIGCVTGLILPAELETRAQYWTERHGGFGKGLHRRVFDLEDHRPADPLFPYTAGAFGSGANMSFRRDTLERMGGFDDRLGAGTLARGGDDLAAFLAAIQTGAQIAYEPGAIVWHFHRRSEDGMRRQAFGYGVGLGAYLTKQFVENPASILFFARRVPAAMAHMFSRKSSKMERLPDDYPNRFVWSERLGILMGIPGYFRSRWQTRSNPSIPAGPCKQISR